MMEDPTQTDWNYRESFGSWDWRILLYVGTGGGPVQGLSVSPRPGFSFTLSLESALHIVFSFNHMLFLYSLEGWPNSRSYLFSDSSPSWESEISFPKSPSKSFIFFPTGPDWDMWLQVDLSSKAAHMIHLLVLLWALRGAKERSWWQERWHSRNQRTKMDWNGWI